MTLIAAPKSHVKPPQWNFDPALVEPRWHRLWRDMLLAAPLWAGARDLVRGDFATIESDVLDGVGRYGSFLEFQGSGFHTTSSVSWPDLASQWNTLSAATLLCVFNADNGTAFGRVCGVTIGLDDFGVFIDGSGDLTFRMDDGTNEDVTASGAVTAGEWYRGAFVHTGSEQQIWLDGRLITSASPRAYNYAAGGTKIPLIGEQPVNTFDGSQFDGRVAGFSVVGHAMLPGEIAAWTADPFGPFRPARRRRVFVAAAGGNVDVSATTDALTLTENAATISYDVTVSAGTDALTLTENAASVTYDVDVQTATASLTLAENAAAVSYDINVSAGVDALTLTEQAASVSLGVDVAATTATLTLTEQAATVQADTIVLATTDALSLTESQATISLDLEVTAGTDALTLAEQAATVSYDVDVQTAVDALTLATLAATVDTGLELLPAPRNALGPDNIHRHLGPDGSARHLGPDNNHRHLGPD